MGTWHRSWKASIGLRAVGMALCGLACAAIATLTSYPPAAPGLIPCLLAGLGVLSASGGGALTFLGPRLLTPVRVSARWQHNRAAPSCPADAWSPSATAVPELPDASLTPGPAAAAGTAWYEVRSAATQTLERTRA